jgi:hypothetical protein
MSPKVPANRSTGVRRRAGALQKRVEVADTQGDAGDLAGSRIC